MDVQPLDGPDDAVYKAISQAVKVDNTLQEFSVKSITENTEAQGEVSASQLSALSSLDRKGPMTLGELSAVPTWGP